MKKPRLLVFILLKWLIGVTVLLVLGCGGFLLWLQSSSGEQMASGWVSSLIEREVPGTRVSLSSIRLQWPLQARVKELAWKKAEAPILQMEGLHLILFPSGLFQGSPTWRVSGRVVQLDLGMLDQLLAKRRWEAEGFLFGSATLHGVGSSVSIEEIQLETKEPGGRLSSDLVEGLLGMMPKGESRTKLLQAIQAQEFFHFRIGRFSMEEKQELYEIKLLLDGDHLLDISIRVPKESISILKVLSKPVF